MRRSYAIGDVHGQLEKLRRAHALVAADRMRTGDFAAPVVHLGDYVDRGPDSRGVIETLVRGLDRGEPWVLLKGNHDALMRGFLDAAAEDAAVAPWLSRSFGGRETLASYGITFGPVPRVAELRAETRARVPAAHVALLDRLLPCHREDGVFFCHAGVRPGIPLEAQDENDLIWIRDDFLNDPRDHGALIVHGHTPVDWVSHYGNRVNLDTAAGYGGPVSAVVIEEREVHLLTAEGRIPLRPGTAVR